MWSIEDFTDTELVVEGYNFELRNDHGAAVHINGRDRLVRERRKRLGIEGVIMLLLLLLLLLLSTLKSCTWW